MKLGKVLSIGHNIADSMASGISLMVGVYAMDVFAEAAAGSPGFICVDFLHGTSSGSLVSPSLMRAVALYRDALPRLCATQSVEPSEIARLEARFGTDSIYGKHFTVTAELRDGKSATERFVGIPGRRLRRGHRSAHLYRTQADAVDEAKRLGHQPLIARVRHTKQGQSGSLASRLT